MDVLAAVQMTSGPDKAKNLDIAVRLVRQAAGAGASLVGLPETWNWLGREEDRPGAAESLSGPSLSTLAELARELSVTLLAGSVLEVGAPQGRLFNTSVLLGPAGDPLAIYRKIHLFDVELQDGATYRESAAVAPGEQVVVADTRLGRVGLSICYDLRFPELYRRLSQDGARLLTVPSAFTLTTGKDHWEVLLRARAIENQSYVLAPAQWGKHSERRQTYGQALIADPWGLVTARCSDGEGVALAPFDSALIERVRRDLPALRHRRL
jgi:predicted amidohydrolase